MGHFVLAIAAGFGCAVLLGVAYWRLLVLLQPRLDRVREIVHRKALRHNAYRVDPLHVDAPSARVPTSVFDVNARLLFGDTLGSGMPQRPSDFVWFGTHSIDPLLVDHLAPVTIIVSSRNLNSGLIEGLVTQHQDVARGNLLFVDPNMPFGSNILQPPERLLLDTFSGKTVIGMPAQKADFPIDQLGVNFRLQDTSSPRRHKQTLGTSSLC